MNTANLLIHEHDAPDAEQCCPVCSGPLIRMREYFCCARCRHSFCEACEGDVQNDESLFTR